MSRRHHGRSHQGGRQRTELTRPVAGTLPAAEPAAPDQAARPIPAAVPTSDVPPTAVPPTAVPPTVVRPAVAGPAANDGVATRAAPPPSVPPTPVEPRGPVNGNGSAPNQQDHRATGCTAPQLRRFIKSRPYVPMHELRRRFAIDGADDDVTQVRLADGAIYVGLPDREGSLLGELLRGGEIGYELSLDPRTPIVVGVYPMRPVPRG